LGWGATKKRANQREEVNSFPCRVGPQSRTGGGAKSKKRMTRKGLNIFRQKKKT